MRDILTVFEKLKPVTAEIFATLYREQFEVWGREFQQRGRKVAIEFRRRPGAAVLLDAWGQPVQRGAWLTARVDREDPQRPRVVIEPASDEDADRIERHVREDAPFLMH